jgi:hypothetical protein
LSRTPTTPYPGSPDPFDAEVLAEIGPPSAASPATGRFRLIALGLPEQLRQPRHVDGDPPRLVFVSTFACRASFSLSRCHRRRRLRAGKYGLHLTGVTVSGVPLPELTQPAAVSLLAFTSMYGSPRPSVTCRVTSSSRGALSIDFQLWSSRGCIAPFQIQNDRCQYLSRPASIQDRRWNSPRRGLWEAPHSGGPQWRAAR